jgi:hypothetical protein
MLKDTEAGIFFVMLISDPKHLENFIPKHIFVKEEVDV